MFISGDIADEELCNEDKNDSVSGNNLCNETVDVVERDWSNDEISSVSDFHFKTFIDCGDSSKEDGD